MDKSGFTLVEVLVAAAITGMAGILLLSILVSNTGIFYQQTAKVGQGVGSNDALAQFRNSLKEAKAVAASYPESGSPTYTSDADELVLKLSTIDGSGNILTGSFDYKVFYKAGDKLKIRVIPDAQSVRTALDKILSSNVQTVLFEYFDQTGGVVVPNVADKVKMSLTHRQKAGAIFETYTATSEANLRND